MKKKTPIKIRARQEPLLEDLLDGEARDIFLSMRTWNDERLQHATQQVAYYARDPHTCSPTQKDRDDCPIPPTCAHCGLLVEDCYGDQTHLPRPPLRRGARVRDKRNGLTGVVVKIELGTDWENHGSIEVWQEQREEYGAYNTESYCEINWPESLEVLEE